MSPPRLSNVQVGDALPELEEAGTVGHAPPIPIIPEGAI